MARTKGSKNKRTLFQATEMAHQMGVDPLEFMLKMIEGDYKYFGFKEPTKITYTPQGIEVEEPNLAMKDRVACAKAAAPYLHSVKQPVNDVGDTAQTIKIVIEDYTEK